MNQQQQHSQRPSNVTVLPQDNRRALDTPHSQEAEQAVIGAVLINPQAYTTVATFLKADDFFFLRNTCVWAAISRLHGRQEPIDVVTLGNELEAHNQLDDVGGRAYLMHLAAITPTSTNAWVYGQIVSRAAQRRRWMQASDEIRLVAMDEALSVHQVMDRIQATVDDSSQALRLEDVGHIQEDLSEHIDSVDRQREEDNRFKQGVPSGLRDLDALLGGWHKRKLAVVGGRAHMGKTGFMVSIALNALHQGARVGFFNCADGSKRDVLNNFLSMESGIPAYKIDSGAMNSDEYARYIEAAGRLANMGLFVYSQKGMTTYDLYTRANSIKQEYGLDLLVVDYFQRLMPSDNAPRYALSSEVSKMNWIAAQLTKMIDADWLNVPMVIGAQINRAGSGRKAPKLINLKGTGNIEEDSDVGIIIHRPGYYDADFEHQDLTEVIVEKNKVTRRIGKIQCRTMQETARFTDW